MNKETVEPLQKRLNQSGVLPGTFYRRNDIHYPLVCYINNITGLYLSSNFEITPLFINRAYEHMKKSNNYELSDTYVDLVMEYLSQLAKFVSTIESVSASAKEWIPSDLLG